MTGIGRDFVFAFRRLRSAPGFSLFSIATLAMGIGVVTAIYSVVHATLGPPPGVADPARVMNIRRATFGSGPIVSFSWPDYQDFRQRQTSFSEVTGWAFLQQSLAANGGSLTGWTEIVDGDYFPVLGVPAQIGRALTSADDQPGAPPVGVLGYAAWQQLFGGDKDVVGKIVMANGRPVQIVGVAPREFTGMFNGGLVRTMLWQPMAAARNSSREFNGADFGPNSRERRWVFVQGRLAPGKTIAQAGAELAGLGRQYDAALEAESPLPAVSDSAPRVVRRMPTSWSVRPVSRLMGVPDQILKPLVASLFVAVGLVLLVACTNLANLMLARSSRRRAEMGVRLALGATRARLIRETSAEAIILTVAGGIAGVGVARSLMIVLSTEVSLGNGTLQVLPRVDSAALIAAMVATLLAMCVSGLMPAVAATRLDLRSALASDTGGALPRWRGRRLLITFQVAASVLLVAICTLFVGEIRRQSRIDTGLDLEHLAVAHVDFTRQQYADERARQIASAALDRVASEPDVESVALTAGFPLGLDFISAGSAQAPESSQSAYVRLVPGTPSIFRTLDVAIRRGRAIDERDARGAQLVAVLNESTAAKLFPSPDPIGRQFTIKRQLFVGEAERPAQTFTLVGIAEDTDAGTAGSRNTGVAYLSLDQQGGGNLVLSVRTTGSPEKAAGDLRRALASIDPSIAVSEIGGGVSVVGPDTTFQKISAGLAGSLGSMALVLALAGLYGVLSHIVAGRTREFGVRLALGAEVRHIQRMVLREGLSPVVLGLIAGLGLGAIARAGMQPVFLRLVPATDLTLMLLVPALFIVAGLIACYVPAFRASRVDPNVALRNL